MLACAVLAFLEGSRLDTGWDWLLDAGRHLVFRGRD
jgi:hypothetical protein